jgi:RHS repeat-associated protein
MYLSARCTRLFILLAALVASVATPSAAHAQCWQQPDKSWWCEDGSVGPPPGGGSTDGPPSIGISPGSAAVSQPAVSITISATDDQDLVQGTFRVYRGQDDVTGQFSFTKRIEPYPAPYMAKAFVTATGTLALNESGPVELRTEICDSAPVPQCRGASQTFRMAIPGVEVTQDGAARTVVAGDTGIAPFTVRNTGTVNATFALTAECRNAQGQRVAPCVVSVASLNLAPLSPVGVTATFPTTDAGGMVTVLVRARQTDSQSVEDAGWTDVTITPTGSAGHTVPQVALVPLNEGAMVERSQCVTVAAAGGAYECGDLRMAHALPTHRTRGRAWTPVLIYNSNQAHPRGTVRADVTVPTGAPVPNSVEMVVRMGDGTTHRATFAGSDFVPGTPRRIGVQWDAIFLGTGLYAYQVQVISHYGSGPVASAQHPGELAIVNRLQSAWGAGWWLAGLERLYCVDCATGGSRTLWVGGDGSTRVYEPVVPGAWTTWIAAMPDGAPDTLVLGEHGYMRKLPGGGRVYYDGAGLQYLTENRLGQRTRFTYGAHGLAAMYVPGATAGGPGTGDPAWVMNWDNAALLVRSISATVQGGPTRTTSLTIDADKRVTRITDPDTKWTEFDYHGAAPWRIASRVDRRRTSSTYGYDAAGKLSSARVLMEDPVNPAADPIMGFVAAESRGVAFAGAPVPAAVDARLAYTQLDGPRTDVADHTRLWLTPSGVVRRVRDPLGAETVVQHGDARFPALPTRVDAHTGVVSTAVYDHRGRAISSTVTGAYGGTESTTTTQVWNDTCDRPAEITAPGADTHFAGYDPVTCNVLWTRLGQDPARTVEYAYHPAGHPQAGQVESIRAPVDQQGQRALERVVYDARGNLLMTISPLRFRTLYRRDALGRDSIIFSPMAADTTSRDTVQLKLRGTRQLLYYDGMDRVRKTLSWGPGIVQGHPSLGTTSTEWMQVVTTYDGGGLPTRVTRTQSAGTLDSLVTTYEYDRAGRKTNEYTTPLQRHQYTYDPAGNVLTHTNPAGGTTVSRYDVANRPVRRQVWGRLFPREAGSCKKSNDIRATPTTQLSCDRARFPFYPNYGEGYAVPEEWTYFTYDAAGNLRHAENASAIVRRSYFPNGQLRGDTLHVFNAGGTPTAYGLRFDYHTATGQLHRLHHPEVLTGSAAADTYQYNPYTGLLTGVEDRNGNYFAFGHDNLGRTTSTGTIGGIYGARVYDLEGRLSSTETTSTLYAGVPLVSETFTYDARGKVRQVNTLPTVNRSSPSTYTQWYSGLGNLLMTDWSNAMDPQWQRERFRVDPLGNMLHKHTFLPGGETAGADEPDYAYTLHPTEGYVTNVKLVDVSTHAADAPGAPRDETIFTYDESGNQQTSWQRVDGPNHSTGGYQLLRVVDGRSYYGHDGKLRAFQQYDDNFGSSSPKGSGLWEEYRYDPLGRRIEVATRRPTELCNAPGYTCISSVTRFVWWGDQLLWEMKSPQGTYPPEAGGTVSYTHAGGIDRPLAIWKSDVGTIIPHENWRGQMARSTFGMRTAELAGTIGMNADCTSSQPQNGCVRVQWPGWNTSAWHEGTARPETIGYEHYWMGSLAVGMRDASGQMYMRNRYYDPQTGQFTQPDPIGLAGGMNVYGFAQGDPVSYGDPYGLSACDKFDRSDCSKSELIALGVADKLAPAAPALNVAMEVILFASPDPMGEGRLVLRAAGHAVETFGGGSRLLAAGSKGIRSMTRFTGDELANHFTKHGDELMQALGRTSYNAADYLADANHVIQTGTFVPAMNAYIRLIGGSGSAKFAFVGMKNGGRNISTFHIKTAKEISRSFPGISY